MFESRTPRTLTLASAAVVTLVAISTLVPSLIIGAQLPALTRAIPQAAEAAAHDAIALANSAVVP